MNTLHRRKINILNLSLGLLVLAFFVILLAPKTSNASDAYCTVTSGHCQSCPSPCFCSMSTDKVWSSCGACQAGYCKSPTWFGCGNGDNCYDSGGSSMAWGCTTIANCCGNGTCESGENFSNCPADCPSHLACQSNTCTRVSGSGSNGCTPEGSSCGGGCSPGTWSNQGCGPTGGCAATAMYQTRGGTCSPYTRCDPGHGCTTCTPGTCGTQCGSVPDGCGGTLSCGACAKTCSGFSCATMTYAGGNGCTLGGPQGCGWPPASCTFTATPDHLITPPSASSILAWNCQNVMSCDIDMGIGPIAVVSNVASGTTPAAPTSTTVYTLSCSGADLSPLQARATVNIRFFDFSTGVLKEIKASQ